MLAALRQRGVTDEMIRSARLGFHDGRITIPVFDTQKRVVNIRRYLPGAPGPEKMRNTKGYSGPHVYQLDQVVQHEKVWLCGGEMKALVAGAMLNQSGVGACCVTAGEGSWSPSFNRFFKGKTVYVCMDVDLGGLTAARKLAEVLVGIAAKVFIIRLPLDEEKYPKGDINDYVGAEKATAADLLSLMESAGEYQSEAKQEEHEGETIDTQLEHAAKSQNVGHRIRFDAVVQGMDETPYIVPCTVGVSCTKDQPNCHWCPVKPIDPDPVTGYITLTVKGTSPGILQLVEASNKTLREATREALRVPSCKAATFHVKDHYDVLDVRLSPRLQISGENSNVSQPALVVGYKLETNVPYSFSGRVYPHPKNQQAVLLLDDVTMAEDSLSTFEATDDELWALKQFQPAEWTVPAIHEKLDDIYADFEANVTRIYKRRELHLMFDLAYHSVLYFNFDGQLQKGWTNVLAVGDSSQGKSEASQRLLIHYGLGERVDCKTATPAGLLGGVQELGNRWFVTWGIIPMHDRRLVILEEIRGAREDVISSLTDLRSSGRAQVSKIEKRIAHARTRLIGISNARSNRAMAEFNFGVEAIKELIMAPEDIRRFDAACILSSAQVDPKEINQLMEDRPQFDHLHTNELCRRAVLWAWTRSPEQVILEKDAEKACLQESIRMCSKFHDSMPLVDRGTMKYKLARLAAALAARLFSVDDDPQTLVVRECHVLYVSQWLDRLYSDKTFGYADYSRAQEFAARVLDPNDVRRHILATKFPKDMVEHLMHRDEITLQDLQDWCGLDRDNAQQLLSFLVRKHALIRVKRWYVKTGEFIEMLKKMSQSNLPATAHVDGQTPEEY